MDDIHPNLSWFSGDQYSLHDSIMIWWPQDWIFLLTQKWTDRMYRWNGSLSLQDAL